MKKGDYVLELHSDKVELELINYCQKWLGHLSKGDFDQACKLISTPNVYGTRWCKEEITESVFEYFRDTSRFDVQNVDISKCSPEFLECNDGSFLLGFYFPVNGEVTDLTVEFEFSPTKEKQYSATINDIHVL